MAGRPARPAVPRGRRLRHSRRPDASAGTDARSVQIHEFSGEGLEQIARESFVPVSFRARPDFRVRMALQEMGEAVTLSRVYSRGPHRNVRTERLAARTSGDNM